MTLMNTFAFFIRLYEAAGAPSAYKAMYKTSQMKYFRIKRGENQKKNLSYFSISIRINENKEKAWHTSIQRIHGLPLILHLYTIHIMGKNHFIYHNLSARQVLDPYSASRKTIRMNSTGVVITRAKSHSLYAHHLFLTPPFDCVRYPQSHNKRNNNKKKRTL